MKPRTFLNNRLLIILLAAGLTAGLISWDYQQSPGQFEQSINDTTPKKPARPSDGKSYDRDKKVRNLDDVLDELNTSELQINMEKVQKEIAAAMKSIDSKKMQLEIDKAIRSIDLAKIQKEVQESLAKVDFSKMQAELGETMKNIDMTKIQKEVKESLAKVDLAYRQAGWNEIKAELEKVKNIDLKKVQDELKDLGPKLEKELKKAKIEIEKAKAEIKEYKSFVDGLDSDGLIDKKAAFSIKHQDGELFINGEKASQKTHTKYRSFLEKYKKFNIKINDGDFKFNME